jgi:hypothetical protein
VLSFKVFKYMIIIGRYEMHFSIRIGRYGS